MSLGDRYQLVECLGEGSYGWVWRGERIEDGKTVALKIPKAQASKKSDLEEGKWLIDKPSHPNVIQIFWMGRVPPQHEWFVIEMEYFPGATLAQLLECDDPAFTTSYERLFNLYAQVLAGVGHLHGLGICHGDIKPHNILVAKESLKLTDFGSSFLPDDLYAKTRENGGTVLYSAPEMVGSSLRGRGGELRYQWEEKVAEVRKKADQEQQDMLDKQEKSIERVSEKLFDTLFTKPKEFGKDLANTIHAAVLKPVVEGVSGMAANVLHPVIYGEDGKGGLAGIFKGMFGAGKSGDPVKVSTDQNTAATIQNSAHMAALTAVLAGAMGVSAPAIAAPSTPGVSLPRISAVSVPTRMAVTGGGIGSVGGGDAAATVAAVAGPSFSDLANLPMNHDRIAQTLDMSAPISQSGPNGTYSTAATANLPMNHDPVAQILALSGGGKLGGGGASSLVSNLKSLVWNQKEFTALQGAGNSGFVSGLGAVAKSPAAGAAGMMLAESGLLGSHMGSWAGVGMGALGGAAIGFQMGGPLGALIGGVAGFGIGIGEKLAGIESPQKKAHDDIKQIYGIEIPQNSGTIKQVVSIAQSQFGGDIAVAVRSPNVRQLVMLYSEATGQKMPLSASTPYAGSLVESGGNLYQQASFKGNAWHSYASNLPTLGGIAATPYPTTPGPNTGAGSSATYLSLNINGTPITADYVADQTMAAQNASYGRTQQSANLQVPGLMVS